MPKAATERWSAMAEVNENHTIDERAGNVGHQDSQTGQGGCAKFNRTTSCGNT